MTTHLNLFRRNLIGVLVVLGVIGVLYLTELGPALSDYRARSAPERTVPPGGSAAVDGITWRIASVERMTPVPGRFEALPRGTAAHVVTISREGGGADIACDGVLTDGTHRWRAESLGLRVPLPPPGTSLDCGSPGPVQFAFILPDDVVPTAVDVVRFQGPITVRLML